MPQVSVIVPVYNVEKYIHRCIDSILSQTFSDFEMILVDDESPDNCGTICDEYAAKDSRITVIHKKNGGVATARNSGLDIAQGQYIAFCDSDDFWDVNLLETALGALEAETADCVLFGFNIYTDSGFLKSVSFSSGVYTISTEQDIVDYLIQNQLSGKHGWELWDHLFCRDIIEKHNIRCCTTCNNFAEDLGFVCRYMLHAKRLVCIPDCLYNYYLRKDSMMRTSENVVRLNDVNEISYALGSDFDKTITSHKVKQYFPILHFCIVNNQLKKLYSVPEFLKIPNEISKIHKRKWWKRNISKLFLCYNLLKRYYGSHLALRILLFSTYLQHGNWKLYSLESGLYYKWYARTQR